MNTQQINDTLYGNSVTENTFLGTYPSCLSIQTRKKKYGIVTNTDPHDSRGVHWCAWWSDNGHLTFFDSFGRSPLDRSFPSNFLEFVGSSKKCFYVERPLQLPGTKICGQLCIHFIYAMSRGLTINEFLSYYETNLYDNEEIVKNIIGIINS